MCGVLVLLLGACGSAQDSASRAPSPTSSPSTPADGTVPLRAPPRSERPVFKGEAAAVEQALRSSIDAYNRKDVGAVLAAMSEKRAHSAGSSRDDVISFMNAYRVILYRINKISVSGDTATVEYENAIVGRNYQADVTTILGQRDVWVKERQGWVSDSGNSSRPGIPTDLATVAATMSDNTRIVIPMPLPKTDFAFSLNNAGGSTKGVFILGIPADLDVASFVQRQTTADPPGFGDGILEMGATPEIPAKAIGTMVFNKALPKGRYLLLSTRTQGEHRTVLPEEYAEFTVT